MSDFNDLRREALTVLGCVPGHEGEINLDDHGWREQTEATLGRILLRVLNKEARKL